MGLIAAAEGHIEDSVERVSHAINGPTSLSTSYRMKTPLVIRQLQAIKDSLNETAYTAAWERGWTLKIEEAVSALLNEAK
jgi:hypothetical protein